MIVLQPVKRHAQLKRSLLLIDVYHEYNLDNDASQVVNVQILLNVVMVHVSAFVDINRYSFGNSLNECILENKEIFKLRSK